MDVSKNKSNNILVRGVASTKFTIFMNTEKIIQTDLLARIDVSEEVADWCDHCNQGHPIY